MTEECEHLSPGNAGVSNINVDSDGGDGYGSGFGDDCCSEYGYGNGGRHLSGCFGNGTVKMMAMLPVTVAVTVTATMMATVTVTVIPILMRK